MKSIQELVSSSSKVIAHFWPMTAFVHHNPIRNLETLPFDEAVQVARRFIGGQGYLSNEMYRELFRSGRIKSEDLDKVVQLISQGEEIKLGEQKLSRFEINRAHLLEGITAPSDETVLALVNLDPDIKLIHSLAEKLRSEPEIQSLKHSIARDISLSTWCDQEFNAGLVWRIDRELIKWCEAFMDEGYASWSMPQREKGFYAAWKSLAAKEWSPCGIKDSAKKIRSLPESPEEALLEHLDILAIPEELREDYLSLQLTSLYGWSSFVNWRSEHDDYEWQQAYPIDLVQYLAVRLFYERELVKQACQRELDIEANFDSVMSYIKENSPTVQNTRLAEAWSLVKLAHLVQVSNENLVSASADQLKQVLDCLSEFPESKHGVVWLKIYEAGYQKNLITKLQTVVENGQADKVETQRPLAQMMFCIDVRSEPFRRNLETIANYETIGFAGFFGIPVNCRALDHHHETAQCPAIVEPAYTAHELAREGQAERQAKHNSGKNFLHMLHEIFHDLKHSLFGPYILVESLGWFFGLQIFERTVFPGSYLRWRNALKKELVPPVLTEMTRDKDDLGRGLSQEEQNSTIETALRTMGLVKNFARLVLVSGHTSRSDNNPYEAALNCGACGGNSGEPNARLFASMANKTEVRAHLAKNGIEIPEDTHFIGTVHNTTTDEVEFYDLEDLPETHHQDLEDLKLDLEKAAVLTNQERCLKLPGAGLKSASAAVKEVQRRSADWSETRPEWGLSGNASFIIARRNLTYDINLEGRSFLNSYDYRLDPTGSLLEGVLMGPMVVGQWINAEHYFSATDPEVYGSGSKVYHNVVGRLGVMSGPQSDLRTGLALQSVASGSSTYHEPLRLFVTIEAPRARIGEIIERQAVLKQLCDNEWIHLMAIDHESDEKLYRYQPKQGWVTVSKP